MSLPPLSSSLRTLAALCAALPVLAGCAGSIGANATGVVGSASPSGTWSASPSGPASSSRADPERRSDASPTTTPAQAGPAVQPGPPGFSSFTTASQNIACYVDSGDGQNSGEARCDIARADWQPTPKPVSCHYDWGTALTVRSDRADFGCVSDSANNDVVVPYGTHETRGSFTCDVEQTGVTCSDLATGHGFFVSRASYRFF